ncbi:MAG TPA: PHP domain-containing protein [Anaerolineaceae bacterium]|nr:PHP domain-containing protein [Anaerolineaceae bacterium]
MDIITVEFHCHTRYSKDSLVPVERLLAECRKKGIDRVVVTDHNEIIGGVEAARLDPQRVIVGEEVMTTRGELLAAYVTEKVPRGLEPREAIARLRAQGAFISVSHPFDTVRNGAWALEDLLEIAPLVDAIETFNSRCMDAKPNEEAQAFAREHNLAGTAGSDAHTLQELGRATLRLPPFDGPESLKAALVHAQIVGRLSSPWVHFMSMYARMRKEMKAGKK